VISRAYARAALEKDYSTSSGGEIWRTALSPRVDTGAFGPRFEDEGHDRLVPRVSWWRRERPRLETLE